MRRAKWSSTSGRRISAATRAVMSPHITYLQQAGGGACRVWGELRGRRACPRQPTGSRRGSRAWGVGYALCPSIGRPPHRSGSLKGLCMPDLGVLFMDATNGSISYSCVSGTCKQAAGAQAWAAAGVVKEQPSRCGAPHVHKGLSVEGIRDGHVLLCLHPLAIHCSRRCMANARA